MLRAEVYRDGLDVPLNEADRAAIARAVLGAFTCTPRVPHETVAGAA